MAECGGGGGVWWSVVECGGGDGGGGVRWSKGAEGALINIHTVRVR